VSESDIIQFIDENIASVTIQNICEQFKINTLQLNDILKSDKPGQLIRKKRMEIVTKMRKQKKDIDAIATASGFSVSYLKKIKG
jgi:AraC-like DNA-binding protein